MRINITARRFKMSDELKQYANEKVTHLEKYYDSIVDVEVILSWEKKDRLAEVNLSVHGSVLSSKERSDDMHKSVDSAIEKMERQLKKYKGRRHSFNHEKIGLESLEEKE